MSITIGAHTKIESPFDSSLDTNPVTTQASGSTFIVFAYGGTQPSITDSFGNAYDNTRTRTFNGGFGFSVCAFVQNASGGASHVFTASSAGGGLQIMVAELIGAMTTGGIDAFSSANPNGATPAVACPSITTIAANAMVISCAGGASSTNNAPTSTLGAILDSISGANFVTGGDSDFIQGAPGAVNDTLTFAAQTSYDMATYSISFAPASLDALLGQASY